MKKTIRKIAALLLCIMFVCCQVPLTVFAENVDVLYINADGVQQTTESDVIVTEITGEMTELGADSSDGSIITSWYIVNGEITLEQRLMIKVMSI